MYGFELLLSHGGGVWSLLRTYHTRRYDMNPTKRCTKCHKLHTFCEFQYRKDTGKRRNICKLCRASQEAARRTVLQSDPNYVPYKPTKDQARRNSLRALYKFTEEELNKYMNTSGNCEICGKYQGRRVIDHNHETDKVRGLLCNHCNLVLGQAKEDVEVLKNAIKYIEKWNY